jgi:glycerophosphoryl diester phosphodiesterase
MFWIGGAGRGRGTGLFIEIKHPTYFGALGFDMAHLVLETLESRGAADGSSGIVLMSFEPGVLRELRRHCDLPLVQLLDAPDTRPFDWTSSADPRTFRDLLTPEGLDEIASCADGIAPWKRLVVPAETTGDGDSRLGRPTSLIAEAHAAGLWVCSWTFRDDPQFLAADYGGDPRREYAQFQNLGIDAIITDFPGTAAAAIS